MHDPNSEFESEVTFRLPSNNRQSFVRSLNSGASEIQVFCGKKSNKEVILRELDKLRRKINLTSRPYRVLMHKNAICHFPAVVGVVSEEEIVEKVISHRKKATIQPDVRIHK